jgi:hypothetical protein
MTPINNAGAATFSGHVVGDPPPGIAPIDLACYMSITFPPGGGGTNQWLMDGSIQTRDFQYAVNLGAGYPAGGTGSWTVTCYPTVVYESATATGSVEFLAY